MASVDDIPDRDQIAADERRIGELLRAVEAPAPARLHSRVGARNARRAWWQSGPAIGLGLAGAAAAACAGLVVALTSGSSAPPPPTVLSAATRALERPTGAAPARLVAAGTDITFPDWSRQGWPGSGTRSDRVGGRTVTIEFYRAYDRSSTLGYAIVAGTPLQWGGPASTSVVAGEHFALMSWRGVRIVTWVQDGHTCILASRAAPSSALLSLAASQDHGSAA